MTLLLYSTSMLLLKPVKSPTGPAPFLGTGNRISLLPLQREGREDGDWPKVSYSTKPTNLVHPGELDQQLLTRFVNDYTS
jgi:hypothetical protein